MTDHLTTYLDRSRRADPEGRDYMERVARIQESLMRAGREPDRTAAFSRAIEICNRDLWVVS